MKTPREYRQMEYVPLMIELVKLLKPQTYVELGVKRGHTISQIAPYVKRAIGIDIDPRISSAGNIKIERISTQDFAKSLVGEKPFIDILFVDADHEWKALKADVTNFFPYIKDNGLILLHDTHPVIPELAVKGYCHDAWKVAEMISTRGIFLRCEIVTLPGPWAGLSIIRKIGVHHLAWAPADYDILPSQPTKEIEHGPVGKDLSEGVLHGEEQNSVADENNLPADHPGSETKKVNRRGVRNRGFRKLLSPTED